MSKHYDVAILGLSPGSLAAAALLARRSWRVLVLGQGHRPAIYTYDGIPLARRTFLMLGVATPIWRRILAELAQTHAFRRCVQPVSPIFQVLLPRVRLDVSADPSVFARDVAREFPHAPTLARDAIAQIEAAGAVADHLFGGDIAWPPGTFWQRRAASRALSALPACDPFATIPNDHPLRDALALPARFSSPLAGPVPALALSRVLRAWLGTSLRLPGGEAELRAFMIERIRACGGDVRPNERATRILTRNGKVRGVALDGDTENTGVQFLLTDASTPDVLALANMPALHARNLTRVVPAYRRFVVSLVVRSAGVPTMLAADAFAHGSGLAVHLQTTRAAEGLPDGAALIVAEALVEDGQSVSRMREEVLATIRRLLPFVERHILMVDSPHDGRALWDYRSGQRVDIERSRLVVGGACRDAEPMISQMRIVAPPGASSAEREGEAQRTPLNGALLVGSTVLPALGQEGQLLAAWNAALIVSRTDARKERMRREMWNHVEVG